MDNDNSADVDRKPKRKRQYLKDEFYAFYLKKKKKGPYYKEKDDV